MKIKFIQAIGCAALVVSLSACGDDDGQPAQCQNGVAEGSEVCDSADLRGQSCATIDQGFAGGTLGCNASCDDWNTSLCTTAVTCGDDTVGGTELCDGTDLDGQDCTSIDQGFTGGTLACNTSCDGWDTAGCTTAATCGDDTAEGAEVCDGADLNGQDCTTVGQGFTGGTLACNATCSDWNTAGCTLGTDCGNDVIDVGEVCDGTDLGGRDCVSIAQGFTGGTLACAANCAGWDTAGCTTIATCGNGALDTGELCDAADLDGQDCVSIAQGFTGGTLACAAGCATWNTAGCTGPVCGDGTVEGNEECDDGNTLPGDGCDAACQWEWLQESEPNGDATEAAANNAFTSTTLTIVGDWGVAGDIDYYAVDVPAGGYIEILSWDSSGPGSCSGVDTQVRLFDTDGTTELAYDDDGNDGLCSWIDPFGADTGAGGLAGGTYYIRVNEFGNNATGTYVLVVNIGVPTCDGVLLEPGELCDAADVNGEDCTTIGQGFVGGTLACNGTCDGWDTTSCTLPVCNDGVASGGEVCDGADLLGEDCTTIGQGFNGGTLACNGTCDGWDTTACTLPVCGDGTQDVGEQCDDGGTVPGDGCDATCQLELTTEVEPNDDAAGAAANNHYGGSKQLVGAWGVAGDLDYYAVDVPPGGSIEVITYSLEGLGQCVGIDTQVRVYDTDGTTELAYDDDGGVAACSWVDPTGPDLGVAGLAGGTYYVRVNEYGNNATGDYIVVINVIVPVCNNGTIEPGELCDGADVGAEDCTTIGQGFGSGTLACNVTCDGYDTTACSMAACGNGVLEVGEECDDGNTGPGDGCSGTCTIEWTTATETEPNGNATESLTNNHFTAAFLELTGAWGVAGDIDYYAVDVPAGASLRILTWDSNGVGSCTGVDTQVTVYDTDGTTQIAYDDDDNTGFCSLLDPATDAGLVNLAGGTYYIAVNEYGNNATGNYVLQVIRQ